MAIDISKSDALFGMLRMIVRAKRDGMMDHREAKELWTDCLEAAGAKMEKKFDPTGIRRGTV